LGRNDQWISRATGPEIGVPVSNQRSEPSPFVSLQSGPREPGLGVHIASGVLLGSDCAIFALPRHVDLRSDMRLHVMVSPVGPAEDDVIERILPRHVEVTSLEADPQARVAVIGLANVSRYAGSVTDPQALTARLAPFLDRPSLPRALQDAGILSVEPGGHRVEAALADVARVESVQARRMIRHRLGRLPEDMAKGLLRPATGGWPTMIDPWDGLALTTG
jgi:hypothetical protein